LKHITCRGAVGATVITNLTPQLTPHYHPVINR